MNYESEEVVLCGCGSHGLSVKQAFNDEQDQEWEDNVSLTLWYMGEPGRLPFWRRVREAVKYIFTGKLFQEEICLEPDTQMKLITAIKRESKTLYKGDSR